VCVSVHFQNFIVKRINIGVNFYVILKKIAIATLSRAWVDANGFNIIANVIRGAGGAVGSDMDWWARF